MGCGNKFGRVMRGRMFWGASWGPVTGSKDGAVKFIDCCHGVETMALALPNHAEVCGSKYQDFQRKWWGMKGNRS